jgi:hypothetical protein
MNTRRRLSLFAALLALPIAYYSWAAPPDHKEPEPVGRIVPGVPTQASQAHNICLRIITVKSIEETNRSRLLKLEVERYYGKITTASLKRARDNETTRFTILFPASLDADVRPGDLINYWLVGYTPMRGGNAADNGGVLPEHVPADGG